MSKKSEEIVWIDCEMTGLDIESDALVEVAVVVTDSDLRPLHKGIDIVIAPPEGAVDQMSDVVRTMHTESGLLQVLEQGVTIDEARTQVLDYIRAQVPEASRAPLAGNSVGTDRLFLSRDMPDVVDHLHYRVIDVSSIKELARRWYPRAYFASPKKAGGHRALADILESIDELRYYRTVLWPDDEGPSQSLAARIAQDILEDSTAVRIAQLSESSDQNSDDDGVTTTDAAADEAQ